MNNIFRNLLPIIARPLLSKFHQYKDAHKGETCYLIGDGVSLKWFDLALFNDRIAIPCGFLPWHKKFDELNTPYLILAEPFYFYPTDVTTGETKKIIRNHLQKMYRKEVIDRYAEKEFFISLSNYPILRRDNITYIYRDNYDKRISDSDISKRIETSSGSLRVSIAMAIYMGFENIYLVGYDYTHVPSRSLHWYEKGEGVFVPQPNYQKNFFEIAKEFVNITTITLDGVSDYINSVTYKNHTGRDPIYQENNELVDEKHLKVFATWPGYNVY